MTTRRVYTVLVNDMRGAIEAAKAQARRDGHAIRTVARVTPEPLVGYRVELVVADPITQVGGQQADQGRDGGDRDAVPARSAPRGSWASGAREDAIAWRDQHIAKGGT